MSTYEELPVARIYEGSIICYKYPTTYATRSKKQKENEKNLTRGTYNGFMSPKTKSQVKKYLATWLHGVEQLQNYQAKWALKKLPYLTFVTTTLSSKQWHTDAEIKRKIFMPFIQDLQRKHNVVNYFWRAESQRNGNIHFHIIIDSYIYWRKLRDLWNKHQETLGYLSAFEFKFNHRDPNSTDIHQLEDKDSVEAYVMKYLCKAEGYRPIKGRVHGCSDALKTLEPYEDLIDAGLDEMIDKIAKNPRVKVIEEDMFTVFVGPIKQLMKKYHPKRYKDMQLFYLQSVYELYKKPDPEFNRAPGTTMQDLLKKAYVESDYLNSLFSN